MSKKYPRHWTPLIRSDYLAPPSRELVEAAMRDYKLDETAARELLDKDAARCQYWVNDLYQVEVREYGNKLVQLNIRRRDGAVDLRDWRHFQEIKNQLVGPECEAIELYPAESRKVDTSNKWHLWAITDPTFRFPVGFEERDVRYETGTASGLRQRAL